MIPRMLTIEELILIAALSVPFLIWGFRHGLDAVIIAVIGVLFGMAFSDRLADATTSAINLFWRFGKAVLAVGFGPEVVAKFREEAGLIETPEHVRLAGTVLFVLITVVAFKFAVKRAGGRKSFLEGAFGALGGAATGYLLLAFLIPRHVELPLQIEITETTQLPAVTVDANVIVLIVIVIIVFGVQTARPKKKPEEKK